MDAWIAVLACDVIQLEQNELDPRKQFAQVLLVQLRPKQNVVAGHFICAGQKITMNPPEWTDLKHSTRKEKDSTLGSYASPKQPVTFLHVQLCPFRQSLSFGIRKLFG